jgi:hypothetical protein
VQFVVAACGLKLAWVSIRQRFQFWQVFSLKLLIHRHPSP